MIKFTFDLIIRYPDITMAGHNYLVLLGGSFASVDGTSASTPTFAAFVSLVNSHRLAVGGPPVGYLNPSIYANNGGFANDITGRCPHARTHARVVVDLFGLKLLCSYSSTVGNNKCTRSYGFCCQQGFYASTGWDPASGTGLPFVGSFSS
jgi:hypothetical protein